MELIILFLHMLKVFIQKVWWGFCCFLVVVVDCYFVFFVVLCIFLGGF